MCSSVLTENWGRIAPFCSGHNVHDLDSFGICQ